MFDAMRERLTVASVPLGMVKRTSLLPARRLTVPSTWTMPRLALNAPWPVELTISRICESSAPSVSSSGPKTEIVGAASSVETGMIGVVTTTTGRRIAGTIDGAWTSDG